MMPRKRATKQDSERRIHLAEQLLIRGIAGCQLVIALVKQERISERQAYRYLDQAKERLNQEATANRMGILLRRSEFLYQQAIADKNPELATRIVLAEMSYERKVGGKSHAPITNTGIPVELEDTLRALETESKTG